MSHTRNKRKQMTLSTTSEAKITQTLNSEEKAAATADANQIKTSTTLFNKVGIMGMAYRVTRNNLEWTERNNAKQKEKIAEQEKELGLLKSVLATRQNTSSNPESDINTVHPSKKKKTDKNMITESAISISRMRATIVNLEKQLAEANLQLAEKDEKLKQLEEEKRRETASLHEIIKAIQQTKNMMIPPPSSLLVGLELYGNYLKLAASANNSGHYSQGAPLLHSQLPVVDLPILHSNNTEQQPISSECTVPLQHTTLSPNFPCDVQSQTTAMLLAPQNSIWPLADSLYLTPTQPITSLPNATNHEQNQTTTTTMSMMCPKIKEEITSTPSSIDYLTLNDLTPSPPLSPYATQQGTLFSSARLSIEDLLLELNSDPTAAPVKLA